MIEGNATNGEKGVYMHKSTYADEVSLKTETPNASRLAFRSPASCWYCIYIYRDMQITKTHEFLMIAAFCIDFDTYFWIRPSTLQLY